MMMLSPPTLTIFAMCCTFEVLALSIPTGMNQQRNLEFTAQQDGSHSSIDPLGPPHRVNKLEIGGDPLSIQRSGSREDPFLVYRLTHCPPIFLLKNFLTPLECRQIVEVALSTSSSSGEGDKNSSNVGMIPAETTEGDGSILRRNCRVAWLDNLNNNLIQTLGRDAGNLLLSDAVKSSPKNSGCEPLQVLHYLEQGGEFVLHHDGVGRVLTVIYYLNGVAGTWFPLADQDNQKAKIVRLPQNRDEALELAKDRVPGRDGMLIAGRQSPLLKGARDQNIAVVDAGDCVAFYNYHLQDDAQQGEAANWLSLHAGLPTTAQEGEKWIANHWMHAPGLFQNTKTLFQRSKDTPKQT